MKPNCGTVRGTVRAADIDYPRLSWPKTPRVQPFHHPSNHPGGECCLCAVLRRATPTARACTWATPCSARPTSTPSCSVSAAPAPAAPASAAPSAPAPLCSCSSCALRPPPLSFTAQCRETVMISSAALPSQLPSRCVCVFICVMQTSLSVCVTPCVSLSVERETLSALLGYAVFSPSFPSPL